MDDMSMYTGATVDPNTVIDLHTSRLPDGYVSILFGHEAITLDFFDVASLERLRDVAAEGARLLREA